MMVAGHLPVEQCAHSKSTNVCVGVIVPPWVSRFYEEAPSDLLWLWSEVTMGGGGEHCLVSLLITAEYLQWAQLPFSVQWDPGTEPLAKGPFLPKAS